MLVGNFGESLGGDSAGFDASSAYSIGFTVGATPLTLQSVDIRLSGNFIRYQCIARTAAKHCWKSSKLCVPCIQSLW
jgi:hypothetical protein